MSLQIIAGGLTAHSGPGAPGKLAHRTSGP
jgi:hypothetical protein